MSNKSPLSLLEKIAAKSLLGKGRGKGIKNKLKVIERKVDNISKNMSKGSREGNFGSESTMIGPGTNAPGAEIAPSGADGLEEQNTTGVTQGTFGPDTLEAASNMFGQPIEGSFDKALGTPGGDVGSEVADITDSEDTI